VNTAGIQSGDDGNISREIFTLCSFLSGLGFASETRFLTLWCNLLLGLGSSSSRFDSHFGAVLSLFPESFNIGSSNWCLGFILIGISIVQ
tara:strand:+ start:243 stop:512 length:270 start_codon:yes stop_codon:yes gene_type:complete